MSVSRWLFETPRIVDEAFHAFGGEADMQTVALVGWACTTFGDHHDYNLNERLGMAITAMAAIGYGQPQYGYQWR